jgi:phage tail sheath protein FI
MPAATTITDTYFPGVHVVERPFQPGIASTADVTAFGAFIGQSAQGPGVPTEVRSWPEFTQQFGTIYTDLHNAVYDFFTNGGRRAFVTRLAATGGAPASLVVYDSLVTTPPGPPGALLFTVTATNNGTWGNNLNVVCYTRDAVNYRFDVAVYSVPTGTTFDATKRNSEYLVAQWNDVSLFPNDDRYLYTVTNPPSSTSTPLVTFIPGVTYNPNLPNTAANRPMPGTAGGTALTGGSDGTYTLPLDTQYANAVAGMAAIPGPYVLNLCNQTKKEIITAAINDASARGDVFVVCDPPLGKTVAEIVQYAQSDLGLNVYNNKAGSFAALYYPAVWMPAIGSAVPGRTVLRPGGGAIVGQYMATDDSQGPWRAPAGRNYLVGGALQVERSLTEAELTTLNNSNVNALRVVTGAGVSIMGARTLKKTGADMYINVRRTIMEVTRSLTLATEVSLFDNNDERLWERLEGTCEDYLGNIYAQGGLKGGSPTDAFYVRCDGTNNTPNTIAQGVVNIEVGIALLTPAEFIIITIGQFESGTVATAVNI